MEHEIYSKLPLEKFGRKASICLDLNTGKISFGDYDSLKKQPDTFVKKVPNTMTEHDIQEMFHHGGMLEIAHEMSEAWKDHDREHLITLRAEFLATLHAYTHRDYGQELVH